MTPKEAIDKLRRMQKWGKMTEVKREALDVAIQAIERHDVEKEIEYEIVLEVDYTAIAKMHCPSCGGDLGFSDCVPILNYCRHCGQKLKKA